MPIASANPFPSMLYVEGTTPANPSSGQQRLFVRSSDHVLCMVNSSGSVTALSGALTNPMTTGGDLIYGGASGVVTRLANGSAGQFLQSAGGTSAPTWAGPGPLAVCHYAAGADAALATVASSTLTDVDATNAAVTFTAPASGKVIISVDYLMDLNTGTGNCYAGLRESTTVVADKEIVAASNTNAIRAHKNFYLTGISVASHTYKLAVAASANTTHVYTGPTFGHVTMIVWAA